MLLPQEAIVRLCGYNRKPFGGDGLIGIEDDSGMGKVRWALAFMCIALSACTSGPPSAPPQPVAFSHQKHVVEAEMACTLCHVGAERVAEAGLPPLAGCVTCHRAIIPEHPEVAKVLEHYDNDRPLLWRQVNALPASAMVHFKHGPHARAGIQCATCHGDVAQMTVARQVVNTARMRWCVDCHRGNDASVDCLTCHH